MTLTRSFVQNSATTPLDTRLMMMAIIGQNADGSPRVGQLGGDSAPVKTTTTTNPMTVTLADKTSFSTSRGASDGVTPLTNAGGALTLALDAAPTSNSRYDVIWIKQNDDTQGDADAMPTFGKTTGVAAASPGVPAAPVGALVLAQILIPAGAASTRDSGVSLVTLVSPAISTPVPNALVLQAQGANWGANVTGSNTVYTATFTTAAPTTIDIAYQATIDSGGSNIGGSIGVYLNGVQVGVNERIITPGSVKGSWVHSLRKIARTSAGNNTLTVRVNKESASATIFGNAPTCEVWTR